MQFSLAPHTTSQPIAVSAGSVVAITPAPGATALVEYTSSTIDQINSGAATWASWGYGTVSNYVRDYCLNAVYMRATVNNGAVNIDVHPITEAPIVPLVTTDAFGNTAGIVGSEGLLRKLGAGRPNTALVCGDSISAFGEANVTVTSITDNNDGTATVAWTAHKLNVGQPVRMNITAKQSTNVMDSYVTQVIDANTVKIQLGGRTHKVTGGGAPNIIVPWRRGSRGWFNWMEKSLGVSFQTTWCAVGGATSSQISDLLDATTMSAVADVGFMCIGMNDVYALGSTFATAWASIQKLADKVRARSAMQVFIAIPPRNSADTSNWTTAKQAVHTALNRRLHQYAQQVGAIFFDPCTAQQNSLTYMDPTATNPDPVTAFMFDFTHPAARGAQAIGLGVASLLSPYMGVKAWKPAHRAHIGTDTGNLLVNADFSANTAGVANTWTISSVTTGLSVVPTVVQRTVGTDGDAVGWNQVLAVNYGTASGFGLFSFQRTGIQSLFTAGTTVQWKTMFSVANAIGLLALEITILGTLADGTTWQVYGFGLDGNTKGIPGAWGGFPLITPPAVVPAGLTNVTISIRGVIDSTQTTDVTIKYWWPELIVLN